MTKKVKIKPKQANVLEELEEIIGKPIPQVEQIRLKSFGVSTKGDNIVGLGLFKSGLTSLPESIGNLKSLEKLDLSYNQLTTLPESIGNLKSLEILRISNNQLTTLPESIGALSSLKILFLEENRLSTLPESIRKLSSLKQLWVINNQLKALPKAFKILEKRGVIIFRDGRMPQVDIRIG